jgi:glycerol kinase
MSEFVLAIDQGTTSSRALLFDRDQHIAGIGKLEFAQHFPEDGWVEHDPAEIWQSVLTSAHTAIRAAGTDAAQIAAIGITNQRETTIVWDRATGEPIYRAIVWQDRRTAKLCDKLKKQGEEERVSKKTGLVLDPYFSATKLAWILDTVPGARKRAENGELAFGTIDTFLIWKLTNGARHVTDATNASRTMLYNLRTNEWDADLLKLFRVPASILPEVLDNAADFGTAAPEHLGAAIPIYGVAGDQQAATIGQACFRPGMLKSTYGTGCFALLNTGPDLVRSKNRLLSTIAYRLDGKTTYALEGSIFMAGATVQWLRDMLGVIKSAAETGPLAEKADPTQQVYLVPAFVGLGAPFWDPDARATITGLTRKSGAPELARAALESVCYQTRDLLDAMHRDWKGASDTVLRVDGGMVGSDYTMQALADILDAPVDRPTILETTALGVAWLAGQRAGIWPDMAGFAERWKLDRQFTPEMDNKLRKSKIAGWRDAVRRTLSAR